MKIRLNKEETKSLIKKYYESKNEEVKVNPGASISYVGLYEDKVAKVNITVKKNINLLGMNKEIEEDLSKDEILGILNEVLNNEGFRVKSLSYDAGISQGESYICGYNESTAYFSGMDLEVEKVNSVERKLTV